MKLHTCSECGGPRRSLSEPVCSRCRKHPKDACPECGKPKGVDQVRCQPCQAARANAAHAALHPARPRKEYVTDVCPNCGGVKYKASRQCEGCFITATTKPPGERRRQYRTVWTPQHPLATKNGLILEHRKLLYDAIGPGTHPCHWCGTPVTWTPNGRTHVGVLTVDHVDRDKTNNALDNLVPSCHPCNSRDSRNGNRVG